MKRKIALALIAVPLLLMLLARSDKPSTLSADGVPFPTCGPNDPPSCSVIHR